MKNRIRVTGTFLAALILLLPAVSTPARAANDGFDVRNGVLVKYNGPGGDVTVPDGVTEMDTTFGRRFLAEVWRILRRITSFGRGPSAPRRPRNPLPCRCKLT